MAPPVPLGRPLGGPMAPALVPMVPPPLWTPHPGFRMNKAQLILYDEAARSIPDPMTVLPANVRRSPTTGALQVYSHLHRPVHICGEFFNHPGEHHQCS